MRIKQVYITALMAAGVAASTLAGAPTAMAATVASPAAAAQACTNGICPDRHTSLAPNAALPGNNQIDASSGPVQYSPQYPFVEGDYYGGYSGGHVGGGFGGGHAGGGGHGK